MINRWKDTFKNYNLQDEDKKVCVTGQGVESSQPVSTLLTIA